MKTNGTVCWAAAVFTESFVYAGKTLPGMKLTFICTVCVRSFPSKDEDVRWMEDIRLLGCLMCQHPSPTLAYIIHIKDAHCRKCASHTGSDKRGPLKPWE